MATKYAQALTPVGTFVFPALNPGQPDNFMNSEKYKTDLKMPFDSSGVKELKIMADAVLITVWLTALIGLIWKLGRGL